jgi:DNA-binding response OmpR family regulator
MPQIGSVNVMSDFHSALKGDIGCPALLLLDASLTGDDIWLTVRRAKARWPGARIIALVDTVEQQAEAEAAGADVVLLKGFPAGRLVVAIVKLLPQPVM